MDFGRKLGARCFRTGTRAYPEVDLRGASNNASAQKTGRPPGCAEIGLGLRCSVGRVSLGDTLPPSRLAPGQFQRNPEGGLSFGRRRCCSLLTDPLRDMLGARAEAPRA